VNSYTGNLLSETADQLNGFVLSVFQFLLLSDSYYYSVLKMC